MPELAPNMVSQRGRLAFLFKDAVLYGGAAAISKAFALITFPLLARHLSVADYGVLDFFLVLSSFLVLLFVFGQDSAVARYYYEVDDPDERRQLISQSLVFQAVGVLIVLPVLWIYAEGLTTNLSTAPQGPQFFRIVLLQVPFVLLINFSQNLLKWTFARRPFLLMSLGFTMVHASFLVIAVLYFRAGIDGLLFVSCATNILFGLWGLYFVRGFLVWPSGFKRLREMLPFALPFGVICLLGAFSPTLERIVIDRMLGAEQLGLYAAGTKVAMLVGIALGAFQTAWGPFSLSIHKQEAAAQTYNSVLKIFVWAMSTLVLLLGLVAAPILQFLASDRYGAAATIVFPLAMGLVMQSTGWITEIGIVIAKRSIFTLYANVLGLACTLGGILLLTPAFGFMGVGLGVMIGHAARAVFSAWLAQRVYPQHWQYAPVVALVAMSTTAGLCATWAHQAWGSWGQTACFLAGILLVPAVGWFLLFTRSERLQVNAFLMSIPLRLGAGAYPGWLGK